jgi:hypothetical protein
MKKFKLLGLILGIILVGCSNPKDATESNFKDAIQDYFSKNKACISVRASFPYEVEKKRGKNDVLEELVKIGMLESNDSIKTIKNIINPKIITKKSAIKYSLTDKGNKVSELVSENSGWFSGETKFCYGKYEVVNITNFSEPSDFFGQKISNVNYTYRVKDIADWANNDILKSKFSELKRDLNSMDEERGGKEALILTNKGWIHEKLFKK